MSKITYENKEAINVDTSIPNKNKGTADDFNEIKNSVNALYDEEIYSTSEVLTNKQWVDGKPIYRKTIITSGPFTSNSQKIDISGLGAETIMVDLSHSFCRFDDSSEDFIIPFDSPTCANGTVAMKAGTIAILEVYNKSDLEFFIGNNSLNDSTLILYITLEYTKVTQNQNQNNIPVITPPDPTPEEEN